MVTIRNNHLKAVINPKGAELVSLKNKDGKEYMWEGNPEFWGKHSPVLFPIVGALKNDTYTYNDKEYKLSRHGFARDNEFKVKEQQLDNVVFSLKANDDTRAVYPFDFELELKYTLGTTSLIIEYIVHNNSSEKMPFSIGAHPAFALPGNFEDYSLSFEKEEKLTSYPLQENLLSQTTVAVPTVDKKLNLNHKLFANDALVFKQLNSKSLAIEKNDEVFLKINFEDFPHLGIWTKPGAPFLCIEPWQGYADSVNTTGNIFEKEGIIVLDEKEKISKSFSIEVLG
ncbi:aldose 1-epimerase [Flavobacterium suaedae]|uniref:Aldose 1-epimerase n=1 Tax=Flavobacterium suaedae TaxID=1767027 RepID=A0ABQ1JJC0_9FLAO|nr:aldose 1-epimerase family protein [Flavobacterium suaedae]GGB68223.1 aldose 1-epimerase [Flavobacterium suaedae]